MARSKNKRTTRNEDSRVRVERSDSTSGFDFQNNRSAINLVLGAAVLIVLGVVLFNFLSNQNKNNSADLGPSQQTENPGPQGDIAKENLPGKYTVKEGDTLFLIAEKYYGDGEKYNELVMANKLSNGDSLVVGQVLDIPKSAESVALASPAESSMPATTAAPAETGAPAPMDQGVTKGNQDMGTGGDPNQTAWGSKITTDTYTVQLGDWLSKIAGRAYGDVMQFTKIAQANNISNPDLIEVNMVLKIPR